MTNQAALFSDLPVQFNTSVTTSDLPLFQLAECKARATAKVEVIEQKTPVLSRRAQQAIDLMRNGAYWRNQLETQYRGGEKFKTRLYKDGCPIRGFGFQTHNEMEKAGLLQWRQTAPSSVWPTEYVLKQAR